jgi:hypothetical protein
MRKEMRMCARIKDGLEVWVGKRKSMPPWSFGIDI